jgi:hypothetical protein
MKEWRLRGFVQDSDDEDDELELETQPREDEVVVSAALVYDDFADEMRVGEGPGNEEGVLKVREEERLPQSAGFGDNDLRGGGLDGDDVDELSMDYIDIRRTEFAHATAHRSIQRLVQPVELDVPSLDHSRVSLPSSNSAIQNSITQETDKEGLQDVGHDVGHPNSSSEARAELEGEGAELADLSTDILSQRSEIQGGTPAPRLHIELLLDHEEENEVSYNGPTRNLRERKAIQRNPYAIEYERYRQTMKARGVRPVRIPNQLQAREELEDQTHQEPIRAENGSPAVARYRRRRLSEDPTSPFTPVAAVGRSNYSPYALGDGEDLPDLQTLFRKRDTPGTQNGSNKRRKVQRYSANSLRTKSPVTYPPRTSTSTRPANGDEDLFDVPPSPPPTSALQSPQLPHKHTTSGFRYPPGFSPQRLPTPETSSSTRIGIEGELEKTDDSEDDVQPLMSIPRAVRSVDAGLSDAETISSESGSDSSEELRGIQRRIKGVLPASWLKLDLKKRAAFSKPKAMSPRRMQSLRNEEEPHRGVAKKRLGAHSRRSKSPSPVPVLFSDSSQSDSDAHDASFGNVPHLSNLKSANQSIRPLLGDVRPRLDDDPGDVMEDNTIDHMGPSTARHHNRTQTHRGRQRLLKDSFLSASKHQKPGHAKPSHQIPQSKSRKSKTGNQSTRPGSSRPRPPRLSIVDVLEDKSTSVADIPQFLKIAARQARRAPEHGRHSPSHKRIRLQTRQDTEDANSVLGDWRTGMIRRRSPQKSPEQRQPLAERNGNQQNERATSSSLPPSLVKSRRQAQSTASLRQTRLQPIVLQKSSQLKSRNTRLAQRQSPTSLGKPKRTQSVHQPAQLEVDESELDIPNDRLRFHRQLRNADHDFNIQQRLVSHRNPQLDAFINEGFPASPVPELPNLTLNSKLRKPTNAVSISEHGQPNSLPIRRRLRKRPAQRMDIETRDYRQPDGLVLPVLRRSASVEAIPIGTHVLQDLGPVGSLFSADFDVFPLPTGTYFHSSTFIGSGDFSRSLLMDHRSLDLDTGSYVTTVCGHVCTWSQWNDEMATFVREVFASVVSSVEAYTFLDDSISSLHGPIADAIQLLHQIIKLNSGSLCFSDSVDRSSCVSTLLDALEPLQMIVIEKLDSSLTQIALKQATRLLVRTTSLQLSLARQLLIIAQHPAVSLVVQTRVQSMIKSISGAVSRYLAYQGFGDVSQFLDDTQRHAIREAGIRDDRPAVEACVILWHVLDDSNIPGLSFWDHFNTEVLSEVGQYTRAGTLERKWLNLFTVLPLLEFNINGVLQVGHRFHKANDNWEYVKALLCRVFSLYTDTAATPGSNINKYVRTLLGRCHHLIRGWGWRGCELIMGVIFDFFASNGLAPLRNEDARGSPRFLEILDQNPPLDLSPEDNAFHIFLKIVGTGLRGMRGLYSDRKIQTVAWRCIPNHDRKYPKDQSLLENDLAALRNHHDLLCTLYWACPTGFRVRIDMIKGLVDHNADHREACRLNIKAWSNLVKFQLSANESTDTLKSFTAWFKDVVEQTINQYKEAHIEAETRYEKARKDGATLPSADALKRNISRNQTQVLASLVDVIAGMRSAVASAKDPFAAAELLRNSALERVFGMFDANKVGTNSPLIEVLRVYSAYVNLRQQEPNKLVQQPLSDESQDYGEWPDMDDTNGPPTTRAPINFVFEPLAQFLSTCFGADKAADDALLTALVDVWTQVAASSMSTGEKDWSNFLDSFSPHSWHQLRDTEQTRKYGPYFLSLVAERDSDIAHGNQALFMSAWLVSLVEREARLKFQHRLTTALLNFGSEDALLGNLPFVISPRGEDIKISATELRERRLALISSVLFNMRDHFDKLVRVKPQAARELRQEYSSYLRQLMTAMKRNYLELRQEEFVTGAYVIFVQSVVEFLQQYTSEICPIDSFFTDSSVFPLPAKDPTYVVGRLKAYGAKLGDAKVVKQLASFIQNVSKRAAVDNEQTYLVQQLQTAMSKSFESGNSKQHTLRTMLIQGIFPSYIEASLNHPTNCGWIAARPIMQSCTQMFEDFMFDFSVTNETSLDIALQAMTALLSALQQTLSDLTVHPEQLQHPHVLHTVALVLQTATATMPSLDYVVRRTGRGHQTARYFKYLKAFAIFAIKTAMGHDDAIPPPDISNGGQSTRQSAFQDIRTFCQKELQLDLTKNWSKDGEKYFVFVQGSGRKEVIVDLGTFEEERVAVVEAVEDLFTVLENMRGLR